MSDELLAPQEFGSRSYVLGDIAIRSDGDGRTVEAYAAAFNIETEIKDQQGHYRERLMPGSFTKTIAERGTNFGVFYNHGKTIWGTPDGNLSVPVGVPVEAPVQDERGVFTVTRYLDNPLSDATLDGIKQGAIRGYSFGGKWIKSTKARGGRGELPMVTRSEVSMREYGPTVFPAYIEAMITGTRSVASFLDELAELDEADVERFRQMLGIATPLEPATQLDTSTDAVRADEPGDHSARQNQFTFAVALRQRGVL